MSLNCNQCDQPSSQLAEGELPLMGAGFRCCQEEEPMDIAFRLLMTEAGLAGPYSEMDEHQRRLAAAVTQAWEELRREVMLSLQSS
jgi:hypothetical protein